MGVKLQFLASVHGCAAQATVDGWRKRQRSPRWQQEGFLMGRGKKTKRAGGDADRRRRRRCRSVLRADGGNRMTPAKCKDNGMKSANGCRL